MGLLVLGHAGTPILAFPSSGGRFFEWEDFGMVEALRPQLETGQNHLICVDAIDRSLLEPFRFKSGMTDPFCAGSCRSQAGACASRVRCATSVKAWCWSGGETSGNSVSSSATPV